MGNHGVFITDRDAGVSSPRVATTGIPFVIGAAPLSAATNAAQAGVPVLCTSWDEAVDKLGYSDQWDDYPLCEFMYSHFKVFGCQPVIFNAVGETATATTVAAGVEAIELCLTMFGVIPDLICAPGFSDVSTVAAAMATKAGNINGMFAAKALVDIDADTYTAAISEKNGGSYTKDEICCWPYGRIGDKFFHMSTILAGRMAATDTDNGGIPYESPSNKTVYLDSICTAEGTDINLTLTNANALNAAGIVTALHFITSFVAWGNFTGCYPTTTGSKDASIPVSRMFAWIGNTIVRSFWSYLDKPMTRRLIDTVLDSANIWLNGLVGAEYLLGARVEMDSNENPLSNLMAGIIKLHLYMTPPDAAQEIDFVLEYDANYVSAALQG